MALFNLATDVYAMAWNAFARPVTVTPLVSQPGAPSYDARGYYDERELDIMGEDGSVISSKQAYLDILIAEFPILPMQGDLIDISFHQGVPGGSYYVLDLGGDGNAGGMINMTLKSNNQSKPAP
jgi:hypothetical protein